jgi:hypothetical protein
VPASSQGTCRHPAVVEYPAQGANMASPNCEPGHINRPFSLQPAGIPKSAMQVYGGWEQIGPSFRPRFPRKRTLLGAAIPMPHAASSILEQNAPGGPRSCSCRGSGCVVAIRARARDHGCCGDARDRCFCAVRNDARRGSLTAQNSEGALGEAGMFVDG